MRRVVGTALLLLAGCSITDAPPPDPDKFINISVVAGANQVGSPGAQLDPIAVKLKSTITGDPIKNREVRFKAPTESGIVFTPSAAVTDSTGIARTQARLGTAVGRFTIEITFADNPGLPTTTILEAAGTPVVAAIAPASVSADADIVVTGQNFAPQPDLNEVMIDGSRARVTAATTTRLDVHVPACLPTRSAAQLTVRRGSLISTASPIAVTATSAQPLNLSRGQIVTYNDVASLGCLRLSAQSAGAEYLVITQHAATTGTTQVPIRLLGLRLNATPPTQPATTFAEQLAPITSSDARENFDALMHERQSEILKRMRQRGAFAPGVAASVQPQFAAVPNVGDKRDFKVFVPRQPAATITAAVRAVSKYMVVYEDTSAAGSVSQSDLDLLLQRIDDPVYPTDLAVFGDAPDLDRNQRIVILLTPAVNRLTGANETSFITGYFDYCDLVEVTECSDTNRGEILYSIVPDPTGKWGLKHSVQTVVRLLPPLAAHEFAHLLHFNQRALISGYRTPEELWLMESLAHFAEDTVAGVLRGRGLTATADTFARENYVRASKFLAVPEKTSLIASTGDGTLEERGAGWLFLKYLNFRIGGNVVRRIETSPLTGAANITAVSGLSWTNLLRDWAVGVYASGASDLAGITLPREQTLGGFNLRTAIATVSTQSYPLNPAESGTGDFSLDWAMPPASTSFVHLTAPAGNAVNLTVAGDRGGDFAATAQPQIIVFRIK